jgi:tRNA-dihydrouridine synthase A
LAHCAKLARAWGYQEVNLNCGCPSDRVQRGAFGACLMAQAPLVRDAVKAMADVVSPNEVPVTVKHRIGIDKTESYDFVRDFVGTVADGGCQVFIVHARNAWLQGLSPKENRDIPPLRYELVHRLKRDFPHLTIAINGGIKTSDAIAEQLEHVDGVMIGREAYHNPWCMSDWDARFFAAASTAVDRAAVELAMVEYCERMAADEGVNWYSIMRHTLGLYNGINGARKWRQVWSNHRFKSLRASEVMKLAHEGERVEEAEML